MAATTHLDLFKLFFTDEMLDLLVTYTNHKITEDHASNNYSKETLASSPHISQVDKVGVCLHDISRGLRQLKDQRRPSGWQTCPLSCN